MSPLELPASRKSSDPADKTTALSNDNDFGDMFKILAEFPAHQDTTPPKPRLNSQTLMAEAQFNYGRRTLVPPPELKRMVFRAIQTPKVADTPVDIANPWNRDPLDIYQDAILCRTGTESPTQVAQGHGQVAASATGVVPAPKRKLIPRRVGKCPRSCEL